MALSSGELTGIIIGSVVGLLLLVNAAVALRRGRQPKRLPFEHDHQPAARGSPCAAASAARIGDKWAYRASLDSAQFLARDSYKLVQARLSQGAQARTQARWEWRPSSASVCRSDSEGRSVAADPFFWKNAARPPAVLAHKSHRGSTARGVDRGSRLMYGYICPPPGGVWLI